MSAPITPEERYVYVLTDERGMDPDQFDDAQIYGVSPTLAGAREDQAEAGCGVIIKCRLVSDGVIEWEEYVP